MKCYICSQQPGPGGTRYHIQDAVGICQHCGAAVCMAHSSKRDAPGAPLLCLECAQLSRQQHVRGKELNRQGF